MQVSPTTSKDSEIPRKYVEIQRELPKADRKVKFVMYLFSDGPREYDFLLKILSLGRDNYWRNLILKRASIPAGGRLLDIACGTGLVTFDFASRGVSVVGVDVTREMLSRAVALNREKEGLNEDVDFIQARAEDLPLRSDYFECATISLATRNVTSVSETIAEMKRCVKPDGKVISMDFTRPNGTVFKSFYYFYIFNVLPSLGLVISRHWNGIFSYLANSIRRSKTPEQIAEIMGQTGLADAQVRRMTHGVTALVSGTKLSNSNHPHLQAAIDA